jgi:hypothetical protein
MIPDFNVLMFEMGFQLQDPEFISRQETGVGPFQFIYDTFNRDGNYRRYGQIQNAFSSGRQYLFGFSDGGKC